MKAMVVPEDPTLDQYILKPVVERLFLDLGRPRTRVQVLSNPRMRGVSQALHRDVLADVVRMYPMFDLFLVIVDRDAEVPRRIDEAANREAEHEGRLFVCLAIEEVEVWMLALHREHLDASWREVREERDPKERFAAPLLARIAGRMALGGGRVRAMAPLGQRWKGLLQLCPELAELRQRVSTWLETRA